ncbi:DUF4280 domain-containing protein [Vicingaceae bacterium]|nr:DUF4280 domain-containing protein [Vicingaceae bacterium]
MPNQVTMGAVMTCSMGLAPSTLVVLPKSKVMATNMPAANIMDNIPFVNILPFAMCQSMSNPAVIALTAAALGVKTPAPCTPLTAGPWSPGSSTVMIGGQPAVNSSCKLTCSLGGSISIGAPGCMTVQTA